MSRGRLRLGRGRGAEPPGLRGARARRPDRGACPFEEALREGERIGNRLSISATLAYLGALSFEQGDAEEAWRLFGRSRRLSASAGVPPPGTAPRYIFVQANVALSLGKLEAAEELLLEGMRTGRRIAGWPATLAFLHQLGVVAVRRGRPTRGVRLMAAVVGRAKSVTSGMTLDRWVGRQGAGFIGGLLPGTREASETRLRADHAEALAAMEPDVFAAAWEEGQAMTVDEAVAYALAEGDA